MVFLPVSAVDEGVVQAVPSRPLDDAFSLHRPVAGGSASPAHDGEERYLRHSQHPLSEDANYLFDARGEAAARDRVGRTVLPVPHKLDGELLEIPVSSRRTVPHTHFRVHVLAKQKFEERFRRNGPRLRTLSLSVRFVEALVHSDEY